MVIILRLSRKYWIRRFAWEHLNNVNMSPACQEGGGTLSGWKMDICIPEVVLWVIAALMMDITLRIARFRRL